MEKNIYFLYECTDKRKGKKKERSRNFSLFPCLAMLAPLSTVLKGAVPLPRIFYADFYFLAAAAAVSGSASAAFILASSSSSSTR